MAVGCIVAMDWPRVRRPPKQKSGFHSSVPPPLATESTLPPPPTDLHTNEKRTIESIIIYKRSRLTYLDVIVRNHVAHQLANVRRSSGIADTNRKTRPVHRYAAGQRDELILLLFAVVRSGWVALTLVAISQAHGYGLQSANSAHDVCCLDLFGSQILLNATNDIGAGFDVEDVNF